MDELKKLKALLEGKKVSEESALPEKVKELPKQDWQRYKEASKIEDEKFQKTLNKLNPFAEPMYEPKPLEQPKLEMTPEQMKRQEAFQKSFFSADEQKLRDLDEAMRKKAQEEAYAKEIISEFDRPKMEPKLPEVSLEQRKVMANQLPQGPMDMNNPEQVRRFMELQNRMLGKGSK